MMNALRTLTNTDVLVGVPASKTERKKADGSPEPVTNAMLAYIHDKGSPAANIPQREFMRPGLKEGSKEIDAKMQMTGRMALNGQDPSAGYEQVGQVARDAIKKKIIAGPFKPLADSTIAARVRRGKMSEKPLIDTAEMINSISYVVRKKV